MLLVMLVLGMVFSAFCLSSARQLNADSIRVLQFAINRPEVFRIPAFEIGRVPPPVGFRDSSLFMLRIRDGAVDVLSSGIVNINHAEIEKILTAVGGSSQSSGILREYNLRYLRGGDAFETRIAFIDLSREIATMRHTLFMSSILCLLGLTAFFLMSLFLSKWALRPVEKAWNQQRQFVGDASHELKTPLTVILANIGILKGHGTDTIESQKKWLDNTEAEAKQMRKLVDELLFLAKMDDRKVKPVYHAVNLSDILTGALLAFESVAFERGVALAPDIPADIVVWGDESELTQLTGILLDNAIKYSAQGGAVRLGAHVRHSKVWVSINNGGQLVPAKELSRLFDRFFRADASRTHEGYGLGLSIAKGLAKQHGGDISAESNEASGTTFTVELPVYG
jgi:signal transduction histidine kinase